MTIHSPHVATASENAATPPVTFRGETSAPPPDTFRGETAQPSPADSTAEARLRDAESRGLLLLDLPLDQIDPDALVRDRMALSVEELTELQTSIAAHGLRLPIEVFALADARDGPAYGLLSGYRRLRAVQNLRGLTGQAKYSSIKAILRDPAALGGFFAAMVEENEVRSSLSHFERGRIAVIAAEQGAFLNVEAAVDALYAQASRAKRSKIRSFALIFEELGDMLAFPHALREKEGLRLAAALRDGAEPLLREALADVRCETAADELAILENALAQTDPAPLRPDRGGRPVARPRVVRAATLSTGVRLTSGHDGRAWFIRLEGARVDGILVETMLAELERLLGPA